MEYKELSRLYYMDSSNSRDSNITAEELRRRNSEATFSTGISTGNGELFIAMPRELSILNEKVLRAERRVSSLLRLMPPIAAHAVLRGLVLNEVVYSNEIEDVHSTRRQVKDAINTTKNDPGAKRFQELARLYLDLLDGPIEMPVSPENIRAIYDKVMDGELDDAHLPDGALFRKDGVEVIGEGGAVIHRGVEPESRIIENMEGMVALMDSDDIPALFSAIAAHYLFEYTHPFYDGNGRTGRYLFALSLSQSLSMPTVLSLSRVILENRSDYYKGFRTVENPLNRGELTFFVFTLLELIREAQVGVIDRLAENVKTYESLQESIKAIEQDEGLSPQESEITFMLMQYESFGLMGDATVQEVAQHLGLKNQMTRQHLKSLEEKGIVCKFNVRKPLTFALTEEFKSKYDISEPIGV